MRTILFSATFLLLGCEGERQSGPPPTTAVDANRPDVTVVDPGTPKTGSSDGGDDSAGDVGGGDSVVTGPVGCENATEETRVLVRDDVGESRFIAMKVLSRFDCAERKLVIGISNGSCTPFVPRQLAFTIDVEAIGTGVSAGPNPLQEAPFDDQISVRYVESSATWGTCTGAAGSLSLTDLGSETGDVWLGAFSMTLTRCDGPGGPVTVEGQMNIPLERGFADVCG